MEGYCVGELPTGLRALDLPNKVRVTVIPCDTVVYEAARAKMQRLLADFQRQQAEAMAVGVALDGVPDLSDPDIRNGFAQYLFVVALAQAAIVEWSGVVVRRAAALASTLVQDWPEEAGKDGAVPVVLSVLPEDARAAAIAAMMRDPAMADSFASLYTRPYRDLVTEGNASAPAPHGSMATGANTASVAATKAPAPATAPVGAVAP